MKKGIPPATRKPVMTSGSPLEVALFFLSMTAIGLAVWGIDIYRETIVEIKWLFMVGSFGALLVMIVLVFVVQYRVKMAWLLFVAVLVGGGVPCFGMLYLNQRMADEGGITELFYITRSGTQSPGKYGRCRRPLR